MPVGISRDNRHNFRSNANSTTEAISPMDISCSELADTRSVCFDVSSLRTEQKELHTQRSHCVKRTLKVRAGGIFLEYCTSMKRRFVDIKQKPKI